MKRITTTLLAYFFLLTYSTNPLFGLTTLYEEQMINLGKRYERAGDYQKAFELYNNYQKENQFSEEIERRLRAVRPMLKKSQNVAPAPEKKSSPAKPKNDSSQLERVFALQVLTTRKDYRKAAEREKRKFESYGLESYLKEGSNLYLRCNPSENRSNLQSGIDILKKRRKDYFIVRDEIAMDSTSSKNDSQEIQKREPVARPTPVVQTPKKVEVTPTETIEEPKAVQPPVIARNPREESSSQSPALTQNPREALNNTPPALNRNPRDVLNRNPREALNNRPSNLHRLKGGKSKYTVNEGYKALNGKQLSKAKEIFGDILKYNEKDIDASFGYALAFMNEGDWIKAYITLGKVIEDTDREDIQKTYKSIRYNMNLKEGWKNVATSPDKAVSYFQKAGEVERTTDVSEGLAYAYSNNKEFDKAIPEAKKLYSEKKSFKSASLLIDAYLKAKQNENARSFFESLDPVFQANMEYNPKREEMIAEVEKLMELEEYHQAKSLLRELYLMFPTNMKVLLYFAQVYQAEKKYKSSLEYYRTVLAKEKDNVDSLMGISEIHIALEQYKDAIKVLEEIKLIDDKAEVDKIIADVKLKNHMKNEEFKEAKLLAKEMLLEDPTNLKLYVILGDLNMKEQRNRDAYFYYGRAFQLSPDSFEIRMKLLGLLLEQNLFDQTQTLLGKFDGFKMKADERTELRDFYIKFYKKYTAVSLEEKDYVYALKGAKAGLQMEPDDTFFIESAGWAGLNSKQYNDAIFYFSKILAKDPDNYTIRYGMGLAYVNLKQFEKAREYFRYAEKSIDIDLLYKVAEIYKDTGFKKDSYRVIKLIEELGKHSVVAQAPPPDKELAKVPVMESVSKTNSPRDSMNTYNPFIIGGTEASFKPPEVAQPVGTRTISEAVPTLVPEPEQIEIKKKSGSWF
jgi:tetratricopeptide (TPR) repeat protein